MVVSPARQYLARSSLYLSALVRASPPRVRAGCFLRTCRLELLDRCNGTINKCHWHQNLSLKVEMAEPVVTSAPGMSAPPVPVAPVDSEVETVKTDALISEAPPAPPQTSQAPATLPDPLAQNAPSHLEPPNNTLYINNLNEKVKEGELKKSLQAIFEQCGKIIKIVAMSSFRRKGQAWVVFDDVASAEKALNAMQSFPFCGKPMVSVISQLLRGLWFKKIFNSESTSARTPLMPLRRRKALFSLERRNL